MAELKVDGMSLLAEAERFSAQGGFL